MQENGQAGSETEEPLEALPGEVVDAQAEVEETELSSELEQQLRASQQKSDEYLNMLKRTQADFVNYRRRMSQEQADARAQGEVRLLREILPVLDDLERALAATPEDLAEQPWVQGLFLVSRRLKSQLEQLGIRQMGAVGETFDPHLHEALTTQASAEADENTILHVVRAGYVLGDRVVRPAQVIVASAPE